MTKAETTAEGFLAVLKALSRQERDEDLGRDLFDLAIIADRRDEPSRPFRDFLKEKRG